MADFDFKAVNGFGADDAQAGGGTFAAERAGNRVMPRRRAYAAEDILKRLEAMKAERAKWEPMWDKAADKSACFFIFGMVILGIMRF